MNPITDCLEAYLRPKWVLTVHYTYTSKYRHDKGFQSFIFNEKQEAIEMVTKWLEDIKNDDWYRRNGLESLISHHHGLFRFSSRKRGIIKTTEMYLSKSEDSPIEERTNRISERHRLRDF